MNNWEKVKLVQLADFINGYAFKPADWSKEGLPIVRIEQLRNPESVSDYYSGNLPQDNIIENGDLIFSWSASLFLKFWQFGRAALNQHLFKVIPNEDIDKFFLKYLIDYYLFELTKAAHGSTMQHITRKELNAFFVKIPKSKAEQTRIAEILSTADASIAETERLIAKYNRIKTGLMQDLLTRGIDAGGNIRSKSTHKFVIKNGVEVPEDWGVDCVGNLFEMILGKMLNKIAKDGNNQFPYLANRNVLWGKIDFTNLEKMNFSEVEREKLTLQKGDLLICEGGAIGRTAIWKNGMKNCYFQKAIHRLRPKRNKILPKYMLEFMILAYQRGDFTELTSQTSIAHLTQEKLALLKIPLPSLSEQERIVETLETNNKILLNEEEKLQKLKKIKTGLMQDLLSGNKRVV